MTGEPLVTAVSRPYWDGAAEGELRLQLCGPCDRHYFYPRTFCPRCWSTDVHWTSVSGRATLRSFVVNQRPLPGLEELSPVIAIVELDEGPMMLTNIVDVEGDPRALTLDAPLEVAFESRGDVVVPVFKMAAEGREGRR